MEAEPAPHPQHTALPAAAQLKGLHWPAVCPQPLASLAMPCGGVLPCGPAGEGRPRAWSSAWSLAGVGQTRHVHCAHHSYVLLARPATQCSVRLPAITARLYAAACTHSFHCMPVPLCRTQQPGLLHVRSLRRYHVQVDISM